MSRFITSTSVDIDGVASNVDVLLIDSKTRCCIRFDEGVPYIEYEQRDPNGDWKVTGSSDFIGISSILISAEYKLQTEKRWI